MTHIAACELVSWVVLDSTSKASALAAVRSMSTHCSGCGSAEMALEFLQVAMLMVGVTMSLHVASTCAMVLVLLPALLPCVSAMIVDPVRC